MRVGHSAVEFPQPGINILVVLEPLEAGHANQRWGNDEIASGSSKDRNTANNVGIAASELFEFELRPLAVDPRGRHQEYAVLAGCNRLFDRALEQVAPAQCGFVEPHANAHTAQGGRDALRKSGISAGVRIANEDLSLGHEQEL